MASAEDVEPTPDPPPPAVRAWLAIVRQWPGTRLVFVGVVLFVVVAVGAIWLTQPSPNAAFAIAARSGVVTVEPMCGERLVWDLPNGRVIPRSSLSTGDVRTGDVTIALMAGSRARLQTTAAGLLRISVSKGGRLREACEGATDPVYEVLVNDELLAQDAVGVTYGALPDPAAAAASAPFAPVSLLLSGHVVVGEAVQLGGGWNSAATGLLESGTVDLRVVPWFGQDRITLRTEELEEGSLFDTHACLDTSATTACPNADDGPARGFLRTRDDGAMSVQLYTRGVVGTQSFGGEQYVLEIPEGTAAWHSPAMKAVLSLLVLVFSFYQGIKAVVRDAIGWWRGKTAAGIAIVLCAAGVASAEPVEIRQGAFVGGGYSFRRGNSCFVVTARHVVPQMGGAVTVLDRTGAKADGTRAYDNEFYDLALVSIPDKSPVACTTAWPDAAWMTRATFSSRNQFRAIRHYPGGRETIVRLQYAGGVKHMLTLAPADRLGIRESDSGSLVEFDGRPVGIVQSVDVASDRVNVLRFDAIDQLVGDRFRGTSTGPVSFAGVLRNGRPFPTWSTYVQSWLTETAGRAVLPPVTGRGATGNRSTCEVKVDVLAWERVSVPNPDYTAVDLQLKACGKRGFLFEQTCAAGRRAAANTPRTVQSQKLTINATVTPPGAAPLTKLGTTTHVPPARANLGRAELEMYVLQAAVAPALTELLSRAPCP